jgi:hypothetical protein
MKLDLSDATPSDAAALLAALAKQGVGPDAVTPEHLAPLYARMRRAAHPPDFAAARETLPAAATERRVDGLSALILETRPHRNLPFVVRQVREIVGAPIQIVHGAANRGFILDSDIAGLVESGDVVLTALSCDSLSAELYNALFLTPEFWEHAIGRGKILVFQTDAVLCPRSKYRIDDFLDFDYIGAAWPRNRPVGLRIDGGVGGLSLRDWGRTVDALKRFPADDWIGGEDGYFGLHVEAIGGRVGKPRDCARFCTQFAFKERSFGIHKPTRMSAFDKFLLKRYCTEVRHIL